MITNDLLPTLKELNIALRNHKSFDAVMVGGKAPAWYGKMLSAIVLLNDDDEIEYISGGSGGTNKFEVVTITMRLVIRSTCEIAPWHEAKLSTVAISRKSIRSLEVSAEEDAYSTSIDSDWPGQLTLTATFDGAAPLHLPVERSMLDDQDLILRGVIRGFQHDLS